MRKIRRRTIWDMRDNLSNKPSLSNRSIEVIQHIMEQEQVVLGVAIERLFTTEGLYEKALDELSQIYDDIQENSIP